LIIGINQVFKVAADTVGTGQALSSKIRDAKAAQTVFYNELQHAVVGDDMPFFIIDSRPQAAFRDAADQQNDLDFKVTDTPAQQSQEVLTVDLDGNNVEGEKAVAGELNCYASVSNRVHRVDT